MHLRRHLLALSVAVACLGLGCGSAYQAIFFSDHQLFFEYVEVLVDHERLLGNPGEGEVEAMAASGFPGAPEPEPLNVHPGQSFEFVIPYTGGPIQRLRIIVGQDQYFELPIDASLSSGAEGTIRIPAKMKDSLDTGDDARWTRVSYYVAGVDGVFSRASSGQKVVMCTPDGDCEVDIVEDDPVVPPGSEGGGGGTGGGGLTWKDTWRFVDSDKAVQSRLALARKEGDRHYLKIQYRVNTQDEIYCSSCGGYHVYASANGFKYRVNIPQSAYGVGSSNAYTLPEDLWIDLDGTTFKWDETSRRVVTGSGQPEEFPWSCADDNSTGTSRCADTFEPAQKFP